MKRAARFFADGRRSDALPLIVSELRGWARQRLSPGTIMPGRDVLTEWRTLVQIHGLGAEVLAAFQPASPGAHSLGELGAACEIAGEPDQAREAWERALAAGSSVKAIPSLLLRLVVRDDPDKAVAMAAQVPDLWSETGISDLMEAIAGTDENPPNVEDLIRTGRVLLKFIEVMPASAAPAFPVDNVLETIANDARGGEFHTLPSLTDAGRLSAHSGSHPPPEETARIEALTKERADVYEQVARRLMAVPGCGLSAWSALHNMFTVRGRKVSELLDDGMAMLVRELAVSPARQRSSRNPDADSPVVYIVRDLMNDASAAGRTAEFAGKVIPALKASLPPAIVSKVLADWPLHEASPDKFVEAARKRIAADGPGAWGSIVAMCGLRKSGLELTAELKAHLSAPLSPAVEQSAWQLGAWCRLMESAQGRAAAETFARDVLLVRLGPEAGRSALLHEENPPGIDCAVNMLNELGSVPAWTGFALRFVRDEIVRYASPELMERMEEDFPEQFCSRPFDSLVNAGDLAGARVFLDSLPVVEDFDGFYGAGEVMVNLCGSVGSLPADKLEALGLGGDPGTLTFGRRMLRTAGHGSMSAIVNAMAPLRSRIEALSEPVKNLVLAQLRRFRGLLADNATPEGRAFHAWLMHDQEAKRRGEMESSAATFLKSCEDNSFEDEDDLAGELEGMLVSMESDLDPRGRDLVRAACGVAKEFPSPDAGAALVNSLAEDLEGFRDTPEMDQAAWFLSMILEAVGNGLPASALYNKDTGGPGSLFMSGTDASVEAGLDRLVSHLGPFLKPGEARLVVLWSVASALQSPEARRAAEAWLRAGGHEPASELRDEIGVAVRFLAAHPRSTSSDEATLRPEDRHYLEILRDMAVPAPLRLAMAASLAGEHPVFALTAAPLLKDALADGRAVAPEIEAGIFEALGALPETLIDREMVRTLLNAASLPRLRDEDKLNAAAGGMAAVLDFALRTGDDAAVDRLLQMDGPFPDLSAVGALIRSGAGERLAALLKDKPEVLSREGSADYLTEFNAVTAARLQSAGAAVGDPVLRWELTVRMTLHDSADGVPTLDVRANELAASFAAVPWKDAAVKDRVLALFAGLPSGAPASLDGALADAVQRVPAAAISVLEDEAASRYNALHAAFVRRSLARGDAKPLRALFSGLRRRPGLDSDLVYQHRREAALMLKAGFLTDWSGFSPEHRGLLCEAWRHIVTEALRVHRDQQWPELLQYTVMLHALAGRLPELEPWVQSMSPAERVLLREAMAERSPGVVTDEFADAIRAAAGEGEAQATALKAVFLGLMVNPVGGNLACSADAEFARLSGLGREAIVEWEGLLTASRPGDPGVILALASAHAAAGAWDRVLAVTPAVNADSVRLPILELRLRALEATGRHADAEAALKAADFTPLSEGPAETVRLSSEALTRILKRRAGNSGK